MGTQLISVLKSVKFHAKNWLEKLYRLYLYFYNY